MELWHIGTGIVLLAPTSMVFEEALGAQEALTCVANDSSDPCRIEVCASIFATTTSSHTLVLLSRLRGRGLPIQVASFGGMTGR